MIYPLLSTVSVPGGLICVLRVFYSFFSCLLVDFVGGRFWSVWETDFRAAGAKHFGFGQGGWAKHINN